MSRFIRRHRSQFGRVSVVVLTIGSLVMTSMFALTFIGTASAAQLTSRSVTVGDSNHAVTTDYVFAFDVATGLPTDGGAGDDFSLRVQFPFDDVNTTEDPYEIPNMAPGDVTFTSSGAGSFTVTAVTEEDNGGEAAENDAYLVVIDSDTAVSIGDTFTLTLGTGVTQITNTTDDPNASGASACTDGATAADADVCSITIETHDDATGTSLQDDGDVLAAYISDVTVSVTVEESLAFSIDAVAAGDCDTEFGAATDADSVTASSVDFGNISVFDSFFHGCQQIAVATNAVNGYNVTAETDTSLQEAGGTNIDSGTCDGACVDETTEGTWNTATNNGFAYACSTVQDDDGATDVCNFTTQTDNYKVFACTGAGIDCDGGAGAGGESPHTVMTDTSTGDDIARIEYKLSIDPTQAAAVYTTQVTYIATPTF